MFWRMSWGRRRRAGCCWVGYRETGLWCGTIVGFAGSCDDQAVGLQPHRSRTVGNENWREEALSLATSHSPPAGPRGAACGVGICRQLHHHHGESFLVNCQGEREHILKASHDCRTSNLHSANLEATALTTPLSHDQLSTKMVEKWLSTATERKDIAILEGWISMLRPKNRRIKICSRCTHSDYLIALAWSRPN